MEFSRQEYWSGLPFPSPEGLPKPGIEPRSPTLQADSDMAIMLKLSDQEFKTTSLNMLRAAAAAKSLQLCLTLCNPMNYSPPGSSVHGLSQARVLEWGAIAFSRPWCLQLTKTISWFIDKCVQLVASSCEKCTTRFVLIGAHVFIHWMVSEILTSPGQP